MDGLGEILGRRDMDEPPEIRAIKDYVRRHYNTEVSVTIQPHAIAVAHPSASLIASLRMNLPKLQAAASTDKRIMFRIG